MMCLDVVFLGFLVYFFKFVFVAEYRKHVIHKRCSPHSQDMRKRKRRGRVLTPFTAHPNELKVSH
jgi:hypothetical protein